MQVFLADGINQLDMQINEINKGAWIVYYPDLQICPLFISDDELIARRFAENVGHFVNIKFWKFGTEWSD